MSEIKNSLLDQLTNLGNPSIKIIDANYQNKGELLLKHEHFGKNLKKDYALETLKNLQKLWNKPVHILTSTNDSKKLWSSDL